MCRVWGGGEGRTFQDWLWIFLKPGLVPLFSLNIGFPRYDLVSDSWWEHTASQGIDESRGSNDEGSTQRAVLRGLESLWRECVSASLSAHLSVSYLCVGTGLWKAHKAVRTHTPQPRELACTNSQAALGLCSHLGMVSICLSRVCVLRAWCSGQQYWDVVLLLRGPSTALL